MKLQIEKVSSLKSPKKIPNTVGEIRANQGYFFIRRKKQSTGMDVSSLIDIGELRKFRLVDFCYL